MPVLQINNLSKSYGAIRAVNNLSLTIASGEVYGILGPNGSGKTTTLGMLLDIINPDSGGYLWFDGKYGKHARRYIGAILESPNFYPYMTPVQNLEIIAHIKKTVQQDFDEILELVNLAHRKDAPFKTFSLGMKQRLAIAGAMIGNPEVLIFDEPTNGLDPQGIAEIRNIIHRIADQGKTVLLASHILDEVEKTCSHVAILKNGNLLAQGTVGAILSADKQIEIGATDISTLAALIKQMPEIKRIEQKGTILLLTVDEDFAAAKLNEFSAKHDIFLNHLVTRKKSLEAEFLEITK